MDDIGGRKKFISQFSMMGTDISLTLFRRNDDVIYNVYDYLKKADVIFSANRPDSELMRVNQQAGSQSVVVHQELFDLVEQSLDQTRRNADSFNVLVGPLVKLWRIGFGGDRIPTQSERKQRIALMNSDNVRLDPLNHSIFLTQTGMELDLGAIAKGYFADQIKKRLVSKGVSAAVINLGGNVQLLGRNPLSKDGKWRVGIRNPQDTAGEPLVSADTSPRSVVTSGIDERFITIGRHRYHHILSPKSGLPVESDVASVTVLAKSSQQAEVLSTICFFKGIRQGMALINQFPDVDVVFIDRQNHVNSSISVTKVRKEYGNYE